MFFVKFNFLVILWSEILSWYIIEWNWKTIQLTTGIKMVAFCSANVYREITKTPKKARSILINSSYHLSHVFRLQFVFLSHIRTCYKKCVWIILRYTEDLSSVYYSCFKVPNLVFWCIRGVSTVYSVASIKISIWTVEKFCLHYLFITFRRFLLIFMKENMQPKRLIFLKSWSYCGEDDTKLKDHVKR